MPLVDLSGCDSHGVGADPDDRERHTRVNR